MDNEGFYDSLEEDDFSSASSASLVLGNSRLERKGSLECINEDPLPLNLTTINRSPSLNSHKLLSKNKKRVRTRKLKLSVPDLHISTDRCSLSSSTSSVVAEQFNLECTIQQKDDISSMVPLYDGDRYKSELEAPKNCFSNSLLNIQQSESIATRKFRSKCDGYVGRRRSKLSIQDDHPRSYLSMFHSRIKYPDWTKKKEVKDTTRALFGDTHRSIVSDVSTDKEYFTDAKDDSDSASFYFKQIQATVGKANSEYSSKKSSPSMISSIPPSNFNSVSELTMMSPDLGKRKQRSRKSRLAPVPVMGKLGPDTAACQEKLERRKKQLSYGQKASNRNRIRMVETNVLKTLKEEIRQSNSIDKQQEARNPAS